MALTTILFDLDGTLLPMDLEVFTKAYLSRLTANFMQHGYEPEKLAKTIMKGTFAVIKNDGKQTNEKLFWNIAKSEYGDKIIEDKPFFDKFYEEEFDSLREVCGFNPAAAETVRTLKKRGLRLILATNPIFPLAATERRIRWTGLEPSDFELVTTYENSRFCKPNPEYFREILGDFGISVEECLMVGNDVGDDMSAAAVGMKVFLLTDCLINTSNTDISRYPQGDFAALLNYVNSL